MISCNHDIFNQLSLSGTHNLDWGLIRVNFPAMIRRQHLCNLLALWHGADLRIMYSSSPENLSSSCGGLYETVLKDVVRCIHFYRPITGILNLQESIPVKFLAK